MNALKTNTVKRITRDMSDDDLKQAAKEVFDRLASGYLKKDGIFEQVSNEIQKIIDCGDYIKLHLAEENILEEAARRYIK